MNVYVNCWFDLSLGEGLSWRNQIPASVRLIEWEGDYPFNLLIMHTVYIVGPVPKPLFCSYVIQAPFTMISSNPQTNSG